MANQATSDGIARRDKAAAEAAARRANLPVDSNTAPVVSLAPEEAAKKSAGIQEPVTGLQAVPKTPVNTSVPRDTAKEAQTAQTLGFVPTEKADILSAALMTYGDNLPDVYKALQAELESVSTENIGDLKSGISAYGDAATTLEEQAKNEVGASPMRLDILQQALKIKSGVGNQALGLSNIFKEASKIAPELQGYGALAGNLAARASEMDYRYTSFSNVVKNMGDVMYAQNSQLINQADKALKQYDMLREEYKYERDRLDQIEAKKKDYEQQMEYLAKQNDYETNRMKYQSQLSLELEQGKSTIMSPTEWIEYGTKQKEYWDSIEYTPGYIPEGGKYEITQTDNGIFVDVAVGARLGQCGKFVNDSGFITAEGQRMFGDSYADKAKWIDYNIKVPEAGMAYVMQTAGASAEYGHVGIVESVNYQNGTMTVVDSNWGGDEKAQRRTVPISEADGFVRPPGAVAVDSSTGGLYDQYYGQAISEGIPAEDAKKFATDRIKETFQPLTEAQGKAFNAYVIMSQEDPTYKQIMAGIDSEDFGDAIGYIARQMKEGDTLTSDLVREYVADTNISEAINSELRWLEGALREESGAVITIEEYKQKGAAYFPRPGDTEAEITRKEKLRSGITKSKYAKMGPSGQRQYEEAFGADTAEVDTEIDDDTSLYNTVGQQEEENSLWNSLKSIFN